MLKWCPANGAGALAADPPVLPSKCGWAELEHFGGSATWASPGNEGDIGSWAKPPGASFSAGAQNIGVNVKCTFAEYILLYVCVRSCHAHLRSLSLTVLTAHEGGATTTVCVMLSIVWPFTRMSQSLHALAIKQLQLTLRLRWARAIRSVGCSALPPG